MAKSLHFINSLLWWETFILEKKMACADNNFNVCAYEVFTWLKSLSNMKLERLSYQFETRVFRSRRSLAYVKPKDLDVFFPSPGTLLLAERRVLEDELEYIRKGTVPLSVI